MWHPSCSLNGCVCREERLCSQRSPGPCLLLLMMPTLLLSPCWLAWRSGSRAIVWTVCCSR